MTNPTTAAATATNTNANSNLAKINEYQAILASVKAADKAKVMELAKSAAAKINHNINALSNIFIGPLRPALNAVAVNLITGSPTLIVGEAGTAKSAMIRAWCKTIDGTAVYKLLSPASTPDQVFGAIDLGELKRTGTLVRMHANRVPSANIVVLDEFFRANDYLWNALFMLLNEKLYEGIDGAEHHLPMLQAIALTNDLPPISKNAAILDRFVATVHLASASSDERKKILEQSDVVEHGDYLSELQMITIEEVLAIRSLIRGVSISNTVLHKIGQGLFGDGVKISPRRLNYAKNMARACALLAGRDAVSNEDFAQIGYALCITAGDQETARKSILRNVDSVAAGSETIMAKMHQRIANIDRDDPNATQLNGTALREASTELKELEKTSGRVFKEQRRAIKQIAQCLVQDVAGIDTDEA